MSHFENQLLNIGYSLFLWDDLSLGDRMTWHNCHLHHLFHIIPNISNSSEGSEVLARHTTTTVPNKKLEVAPATGLQAGQPKRGSNRAICTFSKETKRLNLVTIKFQNVGSLAWFESQYGETALQWFHHRPGFTPWPCRIESQKKFSSGTTANTVSKFFESKVYPSFFLFFIFSSSSFYFQFWSLSIFSLPTRKTLE